MAGGDPVVVVLKEPISFGSETITELSLRRPKAKDFRRLPMEPGMGDLLDLAGALARQPKPVMDELGIEDMTSVLEVVGGFMPGGRGSGSTPSP